MVTSFIVSTGWARWRLVDPGEHVACRRWSRPCRLPSVGSCTRRVPSRQLRPSMQMDNGTLAAIVVGAVGVFVGVGILAFTEAQGERGKARGRTEPCVDCLGNGQVACGYCQGRGKLGFGQYEQDCSYCKGRGMVACLNCGGTGLQPRYLDRIRPEDLMD